MNDNKTSQVVEEMAKGSICDVMSRPRRVAIAQKYQRLESELKLASTRLKILAGRMRACHEETGKHELLDDADSFARDADAAITFDPLDA